MTHTSKPARRDTAPKVVRHTSGGHPVHNGILLGLSPKERQALLKKLEFVQLPTRTVLTEMAAPIRFGYFINSGVASILNILHGGKSVEVGLCGSEGFIGLPLLVGFRTSSTHTVMQIPGTGFRLRAEDLQNVLRRLPELEPNLHRYSQEFALQVTQVAACNRLHEVDRRLARWLLMSADRVHAATFPLTQEFLAHMLGTRRASVSIAAARLQKAGLITYKRGNIQITNRFGLEKAACECYRQVNRQMKRWHADLV